MFYRYGCCQSKKGDGQVHQHSSLLQGYCSQSQFFTKLSHVDLIHPNKTIIFIWCISSTRIRAALLVISMTTNVQEITAVSSNIQEKKFSKR